MKNKSKYFIYSISLSFIFGIVVEIQFYSIYYNDQLLNKIDWLIYIFSVIYSIPVFLIYKDKYWYISTLILFFTPIFWLLDSFIFGRVFPIRMDDLGGGLLGIFLLGINLIVILMGLILGMSARFILTRLKKKK